MIPPKNSCARARFGLIPVFALCATFFSSLAAHANPLPDDQDGTQAYEWVMLDEQESAEVLSDPDRPPSVPIEELLDQDQSGEFTDELPRDINQGSFVTDEQIDELRDDCQDQPEANSPSGWFRDRFSQCVVVSQHVVLRSHDGTTKLGELEFDTVLLGFAVNGERKVEYVSSIENIHAIITGPENPELWEVTQTFYPTGNDEVIAPATRERSDLLNDWENDPEWNLVYTSPGEEHLHENGDFQIVNARVSLGLRVSSPSADTSWSQIGAAVSNVRFDHAGPIVGRHQGTVFVEAESFYELSLSDPAVQETAQHISDAQNNPWMTFPSWVGKSTPGEDEPLHRVLDQEIRDDNRAEVRRTCLDIWGDYDGSQLNCDEYPFASTYEGAAFGDDRYSARLIDAADNQEAGRRLGQIFRQNRVLDGDPFYVRIIP